MMEVLEMSQRFPTSQEACLLFARSCKNSEKGAGYLRSWETT